MQNTNSEAKSQEKTAQGYRQVDYCPDCGCRLRHSEASFYCPLCGFSQENVLIGL